MSPVDGVSDVVRFPRIGKVHLGEKVTEGDKQYCRALPYFVCPKIIQEGGPDPQRPYGPTPTELDIIFPSEDLEMIARQYLKCYTQSHGLVCIGTGIYARRKIDLRTGGIADRNTTNWEWRGALTPDKGLTCNRQECPEFLDKQCKLVLSLQFILPFVKGIGTWQLDTSSFYSVVNVNNMLWTLQDGAKFIGGRGISWVPLTLRLAPMDVFPPGMKKKKVNVLHIVREDISLVELVQPAKALMLPGGVTLIPQATVEIAAPDEEEAPPDFASGGYIEAEENHEPEPETRPAPTTEAPAAARAPADKTPAPQENPLKAWAEVVQLYKELKPDEKRVQAWWSSAYHLEVTSADFKRKSAPEKFGATMIITFRDKLKALKEEQATQKLPL